VTEARALLAIDPSVLKREADEHGALLFHPDLNLVKVVNITGLFIFERLDGRTPLDQIARDLAEVFEISPEDAERDAAEFAADLVRLRMAAEHG
jgi:Coenzyme PQQ synthesis protein D (PqqD)